jgi:nucleotide-binding universal stress UspA family protein
LVPERPAKTIGSRVVIAWKETAEAARALTAAMPFLSHADRIAVISVNETTSDRHVEIGSATRLARQLKRHGFSPDAHDVTLNGGSVFQALLQSAHKFSADLLIMGAYSHGRFRELVFGGLTREVLEACDLPVLLLH